MEQVNKDIILPAYDKKSWLKSCLLGFFIGLAVIVPGISGSTVAIIFKLYDQFLYAVGNIFKKFKIGKYIKNIYQFSCIIFLWKEI